MKVAVVVAASLNGVIGREGGLPWRLPADLARFKRLTLGHPIIMGRKTYESIGRALPGRQNIVISRDKKYVADGVDVVNSLEQALAAANANEVSIIGGQSIFEEGLKSADTVYLTRVMADIDGDKFFDFKPEGWKMVASEKHYADDKNQYDYEFQEWQRAD